MPWASDPDKRFGDSVWQRLNLRTRIYLLLAGLVVIALSSEAVILWHTHRIQGLFNEMIENNMAAFKSAAALQMALVNQKGLVTYFFLDGDEQWLHQYYDQRRVFQEQLNRVLHRSYSASQKADIQRIAERYDRYIGLKDQVIGLYRDGKRQEGAHLHHTVRQLFFDIIELCENYKLQQMAWIRQTQADVARRSSRLRLVTAAIIAIQVVLVVGLGLLLVHQILVPVSRMLKNTAGRQPSGETGNIVFELGRRIDTLLVEVDQTHKALEKSRETLLQAEKMAVVGRLAAGMAHSIRNPFTSVKMRLFSLDRALKMDRAQKEDFEVISQEIRHIDAIVQNFLEFSRPPKLVMQPISPSAIVDNALQLLSHRLDSYAVTVDVVRSEPLPDVVADPEQLKEVLVNLIINACEEMKRGGTIVIDESVSSQQRRRLAVLHLSDSGPGVPAAISEKIFQPFFTTKEEGTGLGLSIAERIVAEHGGNLCLDTTALAGATFVITLPVKES
ncbi:MAG: histidine kinase [Desulfatitalea sp.]|nr:histidine kinase [Desulfatitalea sp.]NNK00070.1 histidine kinase [Desulfatitalea sp.]